MRLVATITSSLLALVILAGCGGQDEATETTTTEQLGGEPAEPEPSEADTAKAEADGPGREEILEQGDVPDPEEDTASPALSPAEREAVVTARRYVAALDDRDGARVCQLLEPGASGAAKLPRERGTCGRSVSASIGYRDPRGLPVWRSAEIEAIGSIDVEGKAATVIPTVFTRFADRAEPSVEDDPIYLRRAADGGWLVAKPSLTFYRAIGREPPPEALEVPAG